ncbi:MAG: hypothetical protein GY768_28765 [Planctomycetaceae bacterium]|nr:hypothetical protein [Planctomycetaceae bacterium]
MIARVVLHQIVFLLVSLAWVASARAQADTESLDFRRLAQSEILDQLNLSDEQRIKLAELQQAQAQALTVQNVEDRTQRLSDLTTQIQQLLTAEQQKQFRALPGNAKLTFNFRQAKWLDVLDWFARQAGLSLVANSVPPGTFTYSDSKSYTPVQALDLLNGVLITRAYTLVRRERMLICLNLADGIPAGMLPRVKMADLDQYGNFELVQVMFPLAGRPAATVSEEITPLIGNFGEAVALPQTNQLLVWTTAGKMRAVSAVIESIPIPSKPKPPTPKPPAPKPELQIYPVSKIDPQATVEMLKSLMPSVNVTIDELAGQINAYAVPSQQAVIKKLIEQMSEEASGGGQMILESYPLEHAAPSELVEQLQMVLPQASFRVESDPLRLFAFAPAKDHEILEQSLQKLEAVADGKAQRANVYNLENSEPSTVAEALQSLYPRISVVVDGRRLVVVADGAEQAVVATLVKELDVASNESRILKSYVRPRDSLPNTLKVLASLVPDAEIQEDTAADRWLVIASDDDHEQVALILDQLGSEDRQKLRKQLRLYDVTAEQRKQFLSTYRKLDPNLGMIEVIEGGAPGDLRIVTDQSTHQRVAELLKDLKAQFPPIKRELRFYPANGQLRQRLNSLRSKLAPELVRIEIVDDPLGRGLGVIASEKEHEQFAAVLQEVRDTIPSKEAMLRAFPVTPRLKNRLVELLPSLKDQFLGLRIIDDSQPSQIVVWANSDQLKQLQTLLESLRSTDAAAAMELVSYPLASGDPASVQSILLELYPDTKIVVDEESRRVMVWTTADQHPQIGRAVEQLDKPSTAGTSKMAYYKIGEVDARDVIEMFQELLPKMTLTADRDSNSIIAWGNERDHELLAKTVEEFRQQSEGQQKKVVSYPCGVRDVDDVRRLIDDLVPRARLVADGNNRSLIVWATPEEHEAVQAAMTEMTQGRDGREGSLRVYRVEKIDADVLLPLLRSTVPAAQVTASTDNRQLLVWADEKDLARVATVVEQIESGTPLQENGSLKIYDSESAVLQQVRQLIPTLGPDFQMISAAGDAQLAVWTTPAGHQRLQQVIDELEEQISQQPLSVVGYPLGTLSDSEARELIASIAAQATYFPSEDEQRLLIRARKVDHEKIKLALEDLQKAKGRSRELELKVYPVGDNDPATLLELLDPKLKQGSSIIADADRKALVVRTSADQHALLVAALDEILNKLPEVEKKSSRVYRLQHADPTGLQTSLTAMLPQVTFAVDAATQSLIATALPIEHQLIEQAVKQLDRKNVSGVEAKVYRFPLGNASQTRDVLKALLPEATMAVDGSDQTLVVTASPEQHSQIQQTVTEMGRDTDSRQTRVYPFEYGNLESARDVLQALLPRAVMAIDDVNRSLLVTGDETEHQRVGQVVKQLDRAPVDDRITRVYTFRFADVAAAQTALQSLLPDAIIVADAASRALVATASTADHTRMAATVQQLDVQRDDPTEARAYPFRVADVAAALQVLKSLLPNAVIAADVPNRILVATATAEEHAKIAATVKEMDVDNDRKPTLQSYSLGPANSESVFQSLRQLYDGNPLVALSFDAANRTLFVKAPVQEHLTIAKIVSQMGNVAKDDGNRQLVVYPLNLADPSLLATLKTLVDRPSEPTDLILDDRSRRLVAVANERQHGMIKTTLDQLKGAEAVVEVFPLQTVDPFAVELAIDRLFEDELNRPIANGDTETQQLFVRGTSEQIEEIRKLLSKMGELPTELASQNGLRVVPFRGNLKQAIEQIENIWPKLRSNKFQVIEPQRTERIEAGPSADEQPQAEPGIDRIELDQTQSLQPFKTRVVATEKDRAAELNQKESNSNSPAILVVPGQGSVTIMSSDEEALNQAAALFSTLARRNNTDTGAGNFAVVTLRNAGARTVAKILDDLFEKMPITTRTTLGRVSMVADDRLNALVIHGRPADRAVVTELLRVLDSSSVPDALANARPTIVRLEYSDADRVIEILQGVYETQLKSGGSRPEIAIPEGISSEVASVLQQINASTAGPLLTLQVDRVTNAIVILAPRQLSTEVETLIKQLDQESMENDSREVGVISLEQINAEQLEEALEKLITD